MTLRNPFNNFYDSDFDSRNESKIFDDYLDLLNEAFIASPNESISSIINDSSLSDLHDLLICKDEKGQHKIIRDHKMNKPLENKETVELSCQGNDLETTDVVFRKKSSSDRDLKLHSVNDSGYLGVNELNWISSAKRNLKPKLGDLYSEIGNIKLSDISKTGLLENNEEKPDCIFTSTYLHEDHKAFKEYDRSKFEKSTFSEMDNESEKIEPKIKAPISRSDYEYHELSTIPEIDSVFMDESVESLMNSNKDGQLFNRDSKTTKFLKANDSHDLLIRQNASSNLSATVMKVIQNKHFEKLLQEPGILEESDLTLISTNFDSLSEISEQSSRHNCNKIKRFSNEDSPSLMSFLRHELSCMNDCVDE